MISFIVALFAATLTVMWWTFWRRKSLVFRAAAADMIAAYEADELPTEAEKDSLQWMYGFACSWFFMPVMTVLALPVLFFRIFRGDDKPVPARRAAIIVTLIKMYASRNPLTFVICFPVFGAITYIVGSIGMVLNKLRDVPSVESVYGDIAAGASTVHVHSR